MKKSKGSLFLVSFAAVLLGAALFQVIQASYINVGGGTGGGSNVAGATFFSSTTQAGPNNTAAETSLIGTVTGSKTIPANTFTDGATLETIAEGLIQLPAVADSLTVREKCGSTILASFSFTPPAGALANSGFQVRLTITAIGSGAGGAFITNGLFEMSGQTTQTPTIWRAPNASNVAFDFTTACAFDITAQWGAAQVGETVAATNAAAWIPGAPVTSVDGSTGATLVNEFTIANEAGTGTTVNTLTKLTGAPSTAIIAAITDTGGVVGITVSGAGTAGNATVKLAGGSVSCVFDGATTAGDYVQISATTAGNCHSAGATYPTSGQVIGRVRSTNGGGGTFSMDLFPSEIQSASSGGGGFIQTLVAPVAGNFTAQNFNTGTGVVTTQVNNSTPVTSITLLQHDPSNTGNIVALDKAKVAATFTITEAFAMTASGNKAFAGLWLSDGGSPPNNICMFVQNNQSSGVTATVFSSFTAFVGNVFSGGANLMPVPLVWFRVQETASARIYSVSSDGITFAQIFSEGNTAHFTTSRYGFMNASNNPAGVVNPDGMVTMYSFKETTP
jgi:hypothetical protein